LSNGPNRTTARLIGEIHSGTAVVTDPSIHEPASVSSIEEVQGVAVNNCSGPTVPEKDHVVVAVVDVGDSLPVGVDEH
jgi:hypothetical protein